MRIFFSRCVDLSKFNPWCDHRLALALLSYLGKGKKEEEEEEVTNGERTKRLKLTEEGKNKEGDVETQRLALSPLSPNLFGSEGE